MARLTADQWNAIRLKREVSGTSFPELAKEFGLSHQAIQKRAKAEKWGDGSDTAATIRKKVADKVAGLVAGCNEKEKAEAIEIEADKVTAVVNRHRDEWVDVSTIRKMSFDERETDSKLATELAKLAKLHAEALKLQQEGERKAWGLDGVNVDMSKLTDEQLTDLVAGKMPI